MYRFLTRPKWIVFTLGIILLIVVMMNLGFWQLRRLDERKAVNAQVRERTTAAIVPLDDLVSVDDPVGDTGGVQSRNVSTTGRYDESRRCSCATAPTTGPPAITC